MENQLSMQERYLASIKQIIADNIGNEKFSVADLAREVGLSRSMLHRKLIRLTGKSATDLITEIRLTKAFELLENDVGTVSEIAYRVGYSSPSYFNKVFKKTYKVSAGDVRRKGRADIPHLRVVKEPGVPGSARSKRSISNVIAGTNISIIIIVTLGVVASILGLMDNVPLFSRLPEWTINLILVILIAGLIIALILYWIYDIQQKGIDKTKSIEDSVELEEASPTSKRRLRLSDVIIVVLILLVGILAYPKIFRSENLNTMTFPVRVLNESGEWEVHRVFKEYYITRLAIFIFDNETTDSSINWMGQGIREAVFEDQRQFSNMLVGMAGISLLKEQITVAQDAKFPHFLTGTYRVDDFNYEITTRLYQTSNGSCIRERTYEGADFFILVDSICSQVRRDLGISEIILDATPDLPISTLMTNHLGAYEHYIYGKNWLPLNVDAYSNLNKAIELDPAFALAYSQLAEFCFVFEASHISGVKSIEQAINLRHRQSEFSYNKASILYHMIKGDLESMIRLSELQVRLRPRDFSLLKNLLENYWIFWMLDRAEEVAVKLNKLVPNHPGYQLMLAETYLFSGKPRKTRKVLNKLLAENPGHFEAMLMLGQAFLHANNLEAAEQTFEDLILLMPDHEEYLSYFLTHIDFVKNTENMEKVLELFINSARSEEGEFAVETFRIQNQLYGRNIHQAGYFRYPVADSVTFTTPIYDFLIATTIFSDQGKPVKAYGRQLKISEHDLLSEPPWFWIEDSLILQAKDLLAEGLPQEALTAFRKAFEENPEHYYLANFIQHLQLNTSPECETLRSVFNAYSGSYEYTDSSEYGPYEDVKFEIEQDHFYYINERGLIYELLPLSEDTFMIPSIYKLTIHMVKENGIVSGLKCVYRDGTEKFFPRIQTVPLRQLIN